MFVHTTCRSCGGPLLLGSGWQGRRAPTAGWWRGADMWHGQDPCKPVRYEREVLERDFEYAADKVSYYVNRNWPQQADKWVATCQRVEERLKELDAAPPKLAEAAALYARWGWPVFPIVAGTKRPATRNGFKDATTDVVRIQSYWAAHPMANIGVATGHAFDVIDVDVPKMKDGKLTPDGRETFAKLLERIDPGDGTGALPDCFGINATPTGGLHLLVLRTGAGNRGGLLPGIDTRGIGGYIVAPPSQRPEGRYRWEVAPAPKVRGHAR